MSEGHATTQPLRPALAIAAAAAAPPLATLLALWLLSHLATRPALLATAAILAGAAAAAALHHQSRTRAALRSARTTRDAARTEAARDAIIEAERALLQRLPDPIIILGAGHQVQRTNAAAHAAFGPHVGTGFGHILRHPGLRTAIDRARAEGRPQSTAITLPVPIEREFAATVIPLDPPLQDGGRLVAILSDRTRERAVERMRADFVANASHELRTPLASLIGFIDTLRGPAADDPPAQTRFLAIMAEQAQRMNRLIDDLLSLSRIELTEHHPPDDRVDLAALLRRLAAVFEPQRAARRSTLTLDLPEDLPDIAADEDQLAQVLQNLLDNAFKYGRDSGHVRVALAASPPAPPWPPRPGVTLSVTDDGQGIARAHIPRLTERFYRADKHRSRNVGGTGLGLAIVKHIVNRHRGQLAIDSTEGAGTSVTVWLPAAPPTTPAPPPETAATAKP